MIAGMRSNDAFCCSMRLQDINESRPFCRFQASMAVALAPQELSVLRNDGYVHFGDALQLIHCGPSGAVLAADTHGKVCLLVCGLCHSFGALHPTQQLSSMPQLVRAQLRGCASTGMIVVSG
jgi:hypothetical protein